MANCNPFDLFAASASFASLTGQQLQSVVASLLCQILKARNPMATCDVPALLQDASCFSCLTPFQLATVQTQLLCEILQSGGSGEGCIVCSDSDPVAAPACTCALAYNKATGGMWYWNAVETRWVMLIGG